MTYRPARRLIALPVGSALVAVIDPLFLPNPKQVRIEAGKDTRFTFDVQPDLGRLTIDVRPMSAEVSVQGVQFQRSGRSSKPLSDNRYRTDGTFTAGTRVTIRCSAPGFKDQEKSVEIVAGKNVYAECDLLPVVPSPSRPAAPPAPPDMRAPETGPDANSGPAGQQTGAIPFEFNDGYKGSVSWPDRRRTVWLRRTFQNPNTKKYVDCTLTFDPGTHLNFDVFDAGEGKVESALLKAPAGQKVLRFGPPYPAVVYFRIQAVTPKDRSDFEVSCEFWDC